MNILEMKIVVDKLPDGCNIAKIGDEHCPFNRDKYCVLKQACGVQNTFVNNNRGVIPDDCPLIAVTNKDDKNG